MENNKNKSDIIQTSLWNNIMEGTTKSQEIPDADILLLGRKDSNKREILDLIIKNYIRPKQKEFKSINKSNYLDEINLFDDQSVIEQLSLPVQNSEFNEFEKTAKINCWIIDDISKMDLLNLSINQESLKNTIACIYIDLQQPWNIMDEITKWMRSLVNLVTEHMLKLPSGDYDKMKKRIENFQRYQSDDQLYEQKTMSQHREEEIGIETFNSNDVDSQIVKAKDIEPLENDTCKLSIGIPVLFILTYKDNEEYITNQIDDISKISMTYNSFINFVSKQVRNIALKYGAGLLYVSSIPSYKQNNIDKLQDQLVHVLQGYHINKEEQESKDLIIPIGQDSKNQIERLNNNLPEMALKFEGNLEEAIPHPKKSTSSNKKFIEIFAEPYEIFLENLRKKIDKQGLLNRNHMNPSSLINNLDSKFSNQAIKSKTDSNKIQHDSDKNTNLSKLLKNMGNIK